MASSSRKYRSRETNNWVIGFSAGYQRDNLLARGLGLEHLREMLERIARPMLRRGANLAYGGAWSDAEDNFTRMFLNLISSEQEDRHVAGSASGPTVGLLYNHLAWPYYIDVTPAIEAQWINACRIVRIDQVEAGFVPPDEVVRDAERETSPRAKFNAAVTLSVMRRKVWQHRDLQVKELDHTERIPAVTEWIALGGKTSGYSGFMPGIFEEAQVALEMESPLYLLGGFGGAAADLAEAMLAAPGTERPEWLKPTFHEKHTPAYGKLIEAMQNYRLPDGVPDPREAFDRLWKRIEHVRQDPAIALRTGLPDKETRELMSTRDVNRTVLLLRQGFEANRKLPKLAA